MSDNIRKHDRFAYYIEDLDCADCLHNKKKGKGKKHGCGSAVCRYDDIRADAIAHGRVKRKREWNK